MGLALFLRQARKSEGKIFVKEGTRVIMKVIKVALTLQGAVNIAESILELTNWVKHL